MKTPIHFKTETAKVALTLLVACWIATFPARLSSQPTSALPSSETRRCHLTSRKDRIPTNLLPNSNHHLAGYALIAIGLLVLASQSSEQAATAAIGLAILLRGGRGVPRHLE